MIKALRMKAEYDNPEDFAADETFVHYCFYSNMEDVVYWNHWLQTHPGKKEVAEKARQLVFMMSLKVPFEEKRSQWRRLGISEASNDAEALPAGSALTRRKHQFGWQMGAVAALLLTMVLLIYRNLGEPEVGRKTQETGRKEYVTGPGMREEIVLQDGTHVWLNAESRLTWTSDPGTRPERAVDLAGEAYFEVAPDAASPFTIHAPGMDIRVLGTALNVKAYPADSVAEASLVSGSIEVRVASDPSRKVVLKPDEKITVHDKVPVAMTASRKRTQKQEKGTKAFNIAPLKRDPLLDSGTVETAWMKGKLVFRSEAFVDLGPAMERKYGVTFHFSDNQVKNYRFTGIFSTETVEEALHALQLTSPSSPFSYRVDGKDIYIGLMKR